MNGDKKLKKNSNHNSNHKEASFAERIAQNITLFVGSTAAFVGAVSIIIFWLIGGPFNNWSDTWLIIINNVCSVITFLMVFLIQRAQNKEFLALNLKLSELVASLEGPNNQLINAHEYSEEELKLLQEYYSKVGFETKNFRKAILSMRNGAKIKPQTGIAQNSTKQNNNRQSSNKRYYRKKNYKKKEKENL